MTKTTDLVPSKDGINHINVYSKGETKLGRQLSNFAFSPFNHPEDGQFNSVEGYWYWLGCKQDRLRKVWGYAAKRLGREYGAPDWQSDAEFKRKIRLAIRSKIAQNPALKKQLQASSLPLTHYYYYGNMNNCKVITVSDGQWIIDELELVRSELKHGHSI